MKVWTRLRPAAAIVLAMAVTAGAQTPEGQAKGSDEKAPPKADAGIPVPPESSSVTKHDLTVGGQVIHYTATAGNLLIRDDQDKPNASIFLSLIHI